MGEWEAPRKITKDSGSENKAAGTCMFMERQMFVSATQTATVSI